MFKKWHKWVLKTFWGVKWSEYPLHCLKKPPFGCSQPPQRNLGSEMFGNLTSLLSGHSPSWDEKNTLQHKKPSTSMGWDFHLLERKPVGTRWHKNSIPLSPTYKGCGLNHISKLAVAQSNCAVWAEQESLRTDRHRKHILHCTSRLHLGYSFVCPKHLAARAFLWGHKCCERLISKNVAGSVLFVQAPTVCVWSPL